MMPEPDVAPHAVLSCAQMAQADAWAVAHGVSGVALMEAAGHAVVKALLAQWSVRPVLVLCGPGNNGGDGYVAARLLLEAGWAVRVASLVPVERMTGDALWHARLWQAAQAERMGCEPSAVEPVPFKMDARGVKGMHEMLDGIALVVDALFGAGLQRPLDAPVRHLLAGIAKAGLPMLAIDVPSGLDGDTGRNLGAQACTLCVTFFRKKPAHLLMPGRALCGHVVVADIGIPPAALQLDAPVHFIQENHPALWSWCCLPPGQGGHKYQRGHALVWGGARMVGAARLTARAAARSGAGLVTLLVPATVWPVYAASLMSAMAQPVADGGADAMLQAWAHELAHLRWRALALGPGAGLGLLAHLHDHSLNDMLDDTQEVLRRMVLLALSLPLAPTAGHALVLDADALTAFEGHADLLFQAIQSSERAVVLTPHEGEFSRLFGEAADNTSADKISRTRQAAARSGAVVLHKGADTVIAAPDGRVVINANAPPWLATAGSGDVLTGLIAGWLAQGVAAMEAACMAAWVHGACAQAFGPGLLAEDLPEQVPGVLRQLWPLQS